MYTHSIHYYDEDDIIFLLHTYDITIGKLYTRVCNNSDVTWAFRQLTSRLLPRKACNISFVALGEECCPRLRLGHTCTSTPRATKLMLHAFLGSNLYVLKQNLIRYTTL